jgi:hypothetical protein
LKHGALERGIGLRWLDPSKSTEEHNSTMVQDAAEDGKNLRVLTRSWNNLLILKEKQKDVNRKRVYEREKLRAAVRKILVQHRTICRQMWMVQWPLCFRMKESSWCHMPSIKPYQINHSALAQVFPQPGQHDRQIRSRHVQQDWYEQEDCFFTKEEKVQRWLQSMMSEIRMVKRVSGYLQRNKEDQTYQQNDAYLLIHNLYQAGMLKIQKVGWKVVYLALLTFEIGLVGKYLPSLSLRNSSTEVGIKHFIKLTAVYIDETGPRKYALM